MPYKKKRALNVAQFILEKSLKRKDNNQQVRDIVESLLALLKPNSQSIVDYEFLADEWIAILQPHLNVKRGNIGRKKIVLNLSNLKQDYKKFDFTDRTFVQMFENAPVTEDIDSKIASCIIGIRNGA